MAELWSGSVRCFPRRILHPVDESTIVAALADARGGDLPIRAVGAGHSYSALVATRGTIVSLDHFAAITNVDVTARRAVIGAGTRLHALGVALRERGLALQNQGHGGNQSLGGAIATATHGTGISLRCLSASIVGLRMILADGSILECDAVREPDVWRCARLNLGCLGVITSITLELRPAYRLRDETSVVPFEAGLASLPDLIRRHHHVECLWSPHADVIGVRTMSETNEPVNDSPVRRWFAGTVVGTGLFGLFAGVSRLPGLAGSRRALSRFIARLAGSKPHVNWSDRVLADGRTIRANDMEYAVPAERGPDAIRAVRDYVRGSRTPVLFPVEYRFVAADDIPLSPFYRRDSAVLSIRQDAKVDLDPYFRDVEQILREMGGRPHWGKMHTLSWRELEPLYAEWELFQRVRKRLDPRGKLLTTYLIHVLGDG